MYGSTITQRIHKLTAYQSSTWWTIYNITIHQVAEESEPPSHEQIFTSLHF